MTTVQKNLAKGLTVHITRKELKSSVVGYTNSIKLTEFYTTCVAKAIFTEVKI